MFYSMGTSIDEMESGDIEVVANLWLEGVEEFLSLLEVDWGDLVTMLGDVMN